MTEIRCLYGTSVAEIFFAGLENNEHIEAIALSVLRQDGTVTASCPSTTRANLARLVMAMGEYKKRAFVVAGQRQPTDHLWYPRPSVMDDGVSRLNNQKARG